MISRIVFALFAFALCAENVLAQDAPPTYYDGLAWSRSKAFLPTETGLQDNNSLDLMVSWWPEGLHVTRHVIMPLSKSFCDTLPDVYQGPYLLHKALTRCIRVPTREYVDAMKENLESRILVKVQTLSTELQAADAVKGLLARIEDLERQLAELKNSRK